MVRIVTSVFGGGDGLQDDAGGSFEGWPTMLENLRLHLTHHRGQQAHGVRAFGTSELDAEEAWSGLEADLGLTGQRAGDRLEVDSGAIGLAGTVERVGEAEVRRGWTLPHPATRWSPPAGRARPSVLLAAWRHGVGAADTAAGAGRGWRAWLAERFPAVEVPSA